MSNLNEDIYHTDVLERARKLRKEAEALEAGENVRQRLLKLIEISEDPYYDQYLNQMLKDLESGKATPFQVSKEADRTYGLYLQRMGKNGVQASGQAKEASFNKLQKQEETQKKQPVPKDAMEFKIGAGIFSIVGAVFVLAAFVIFGFNFLQGIWQGICLYAASAAVILLSELLVKRLNKSFSLVITGIGISCLYISTVINYQVLKNINGIAASVFTLLIALFSILLSRKKDAASIRMISFFGCYICFLPIKGFESELSFMIMTGMILIINIVSIFLPNQKNSTVINIIHLTAHTVFTGIVAEVVLAGGMNAMYVAFFVITSLVLVNMIYLRQGDKNNLLSTVFYSLALGFIAIFLVSAGCFEHGVDNEKLLLFYKLLTEVMAVAAAVVFFILWGRNKCRWIQYYFIAAIVILFNGFSDYRLETTIGCIAVFVLTRALYKVKEVEVLDCILAVLTVLQGLYMCKTWYVIPFAVVLFLSAFMIRRTILFHEIVLTVGASLGILFQFDSNWTLPGCVGMLFIFFLLFNHLPVLIDQNKLPYNVVNIVIAGFFCLCTVFCKEYYINAVTMLIGAVMIIVAFRERYKLNLPKKYLFLAGFLVYMIFASHFETPIIVSILLMLVAIGCVGIGFALKDKMYRICGLVMAILVCVKLLVYDFAELESLPKAILFLVVGMIALGISFLYIYLEKKEDREEIAVETGKETEVVAESPQEKQEDEAGTKNSVENLGEE